MESPELVVRQGQITGKRQISFGIALCALVYFVSYLTRINFAAVMVEIISSEGLLKTEVGGALAALFVCYGFGQLVSGWIGDHISPKTLIFVGILVSCGANIGITVCSSSAVMVAVWGVNGFAQAMLWPPLVRFMAVRFDDAGYKKACLAANRASAIATAVIYLISPLLIKFGGWRAVFYFSAGIGVLCAFLWLASNRRLEAKFGPLPDTDVTTTEQSTSVPQNPLKGLGFLVPILGAIILQGLLRDGITSWMPTYIAEVFHLDSSASILTGVTMPLFTIVCYQLIYEFNRRLVHNEVTCGAIFFFFGCAALAILHFFGSNAIVCVCMFTLAVGCMHGVNIMLVCLLPPYFAKTGKVAFLGGFLNTFTYVGSAVSTYGLAFLTENSGWSSTVLIWLGAAIFGTLFCVLSIGNWQKYKTSEE